MTQAMLENRDDLALAGASSKGTIEDQGQDRSCPSQPNLPLDRDPLGAGSDDASNSLPHASLEDTHVRSCPPFPIVPSTGKPNWSKLRKLTQTLTPDLKPDKNVKDKSNKLFLKRTADAYNNLKKRIGRQPPFGLVDLRRIVATALRRKCRWCKVKLKPKTWSLDHKVPVARSKDSDPHQLPNLDVQCCKKCNIAKGLLTWKEFKQLNELLNTWEQRSREDVLTRLKAGGARFNRA